MSRSLGNIIADSLATGLGYAERLQAGLTVDNFARFASPGGVAVQSNHPSFVYGHLALYPSRIVGELKQDASEITPGEKYQDVYSPRATCRDDADGAIYPPMEDVLKAFSDNYSLAMEVLRNADDAAFAEPNPLERMAERFPTIGSMHTFYCGGHLMMHLGQLSAWRRMMSLDPV